SVYPEERRACANLTTQHDTSAWLTRAPVLHTQPELKSAGQSPSVQTQHSRSFLDLQDRACSILRRRLKPALLKITSTVLWAGSHTARRRFRRTNPRANFLRGSSLRPLAAAPAFRAGIR